VSGAFSTHKRRLCPKAEPDHTQQHNNNATHALGLLNRIASLRNPSIVIARLLSPFTSGFLRAHRENFAPFAF
jgi:hypothetical protein